MRPSQHRGLLPTAAALALLLAATASATATSHEAGPHLHAPQDEYAPREPVTLLITNNQTTPAHGTPTITIQECTLEERLCHDTIHTWRGEERTLEPGETLEVPWDKTNDDGQSANEAHHQATLEWDTDQGTHTTHTDPFYLHEPSLPNPDAPRITIHEPTNAPLANTTAALHVTVHANAPLDTVQILVNGETLVSEHDLETPTYETQRSLEQPPGAHVLTVQALDVDDRANETTRTYTIAPDQRTTAGPLGFDTIDDGGFEDIRIDGTPLFTSVETTTPGTLHARTGSIALAFWSHQGAHVTMTLAQGWTTTPQGQGLLLEHDAIEHPVIVTIGHGTGISTGPDTLVANLATNDGVIVRPLTEDPGDALIGDAILEGHLGAEIDVTDDDVTVFPYAPVNVTVAPGPERVAMILDAPRQEGLTFVTHLDAGAFPYASVYLDGEELSLAEAPEDVFLDDDAQAFIAEGDETTRVFVNVDSFSTRDLVVEAVQRAGAFLTFGTVLLAGAVVTLAGWGLFRRS